MQILKDDNKESDANVLLHFRNKATSKDEETNILDNSDIITPPDTRTNDIQKLHKN